MPASNVRYRRCRMPRARRARRRKRVSGRPGWRGDVRWPGAEAPVPPHRRRERRDRGCVRGATPPARRHARLRARRAGGRRARSSFAPGSSGRGRDVDPVRHDRPADVDGPRPGRPHRAARLRLPGAVRDRRRRVLRHAGRADGRGGPPPWRDALRPGREGAPLPAAAVRGSGEPAAGPGQAGARVDDGRGRDGRGDRGRRPSRARPQPGEAQLRRRAALPRRRVGRRA